MKKTLIITGSTGFIGKNFAYYLKKDNLTSLIELTRQTGFDLTKANCLEQLQNVQVDHVLHLAQSKEYRNFPEGASDMRMVNIDATALLLEWSRLNDIKRFIFASTGNIYSPSSSLLKESDDTIPNSFYGASKLASEHLVNQYSKFFEIINLRIFTTYGPGQVGMLIPNMINNVKSGLEIKLAKKIGLVTTPLFINDCVKILEKLTSCPLSNPSQTLNLAGPQKVSLFDIIAIIEDHLKIKANIKITDGEPAYLTADNQKLLETIGDFSFTNINEGLKLTLNDYNS